MKTDSKQGSYEIVEARTRRRMRLAMQRLWLVGQILPVGARLIAQHIFQSEENLPLEIVYTFPLPRDAALRRFRVSGKGFSIHSQLKPVDEAIRLYEQGMERGSLSTLARNYRDGLVSLTVGNIQPGDLVKVQLEMLAGVENHDHGLRFRFPFTLAPAYHARAKATEVSRGIGEMELPEDEFGDLILPQFAADSSSLHQVGFDLRIVFPAPLREVSSPSHSIKLDLENPSEPRIAMARESDVPNRDLVLDVRTRSPLFAVSSGIGKDGRGRFAAIVPSTRFGNKQTTEARRVVFLLDRSGSMNGVPLQQASKAVEVCLAAMSEQDLFGLVAFDDRMERFTSELVPASLEHRRESEGFLKKITARGGTELAKGFEMAASLLSKEGGDVLVITDGQVSGTEDILERARSIDARIHCLGIGSASQDRFLALLARQTGGQSRFLTPRERVDLPAVDLFASIGCPVARQIRVDASQLPGTTIAPEPRSVAFAGTPLVILGEADPAGGRLLVEWETQGERASFECPVKMDCDRVGETLRLIHGARLITDLESRFAIDSQTSLLRAEKKNEGRMAKQLERLSEDFGLASQRMALVAVVTRETDKPGALPETRIVPVGMPEDTNFSAYFRDLSVCGSSVKMMVSSDHMLADLGTNVSERGIKFSRSARGPAEAESDRSLDLVRPPEELLLDLAARIEPDGGIPGMDRDDRVVGSLLALLCFTQKGHTREEGAFRGHVQRLILFLEHASASLAEPKRCTVESILQTVAIASISVSWNWNWADQTANFFYKRREPVGVYWWRIGRALAKQT